MTITQAIPLVVSVASVIFVYFGLYLRGNDKQNDLAIDLRKEFGKAIQEFREEFNNIIQTLRNDLTQLIKANAEATGRYEATCKECVKKVDLIGGIDNRLAKMEAQNAIYFKTIDPFLAAAIHSPIHVERDALMEKLEGDTLSYEEAKELEIELLKAIPEEKDGNKAWLKTLALGSVRRVIVGFEFDQQHTTLQHRKMGA
jgi:hypothetical protein